MEIALSVVTKLPRQLREEDGRALAGAYNEAGERYQNYADGSAKRLYAFDGPHSFSDQQTWIAIEERLHRLRLSGARRLRVLDLGCGPGTWMRRIVTRAHQMGFIDISARGIDLSDFQVQRARTSCRALAERGDIHLTFEVGDIRQAFPETDGSVDLCLCLYGVLNHVAAPELRTLLREVARVTKGWFISTVRAIGSTPTIYVESVSGARSFRQDNFTDRLEVEFRDGRSASFPSHLFNHVEMEGLVRSYLKLEQLRGLDLFHSRFAADPRWNPAGHASPALAKELNLLEAHYGQSPQFMDHATHLLVVAAPLPPGSAR